MARPATVEIQPEQRGLVRQKLAEKSLCHFSRQAWPILESREFVSGWHTESMSAHLEAVTRGEIKKLLINIPPRCMKSLMTCVFWFCWSWIHRPETRWMFYSYADTLALRDAVKCRNIIRSPWYQERWREKFSFAADQNQKRRFENDKNGFRIAAPTGGVSLGEGGDFICVDDPHNVKKAESVLERETIIDWWSQGMSTRGNTKETARVIIMQRLNERDLSGYVLETDPAFVHFYLPMRFEEGRVCITQLGGGWRDPRTVEGELLCPDRFDEESVKTLEDTLGPYGTAGQLQQRPAPRGGSIFEQSKFRYFVVRRLAPEFFRRHEELAIEPERQVIFEFTSKAGRRQQVFAWDCWWFQTIDTATSEDAKSNYTVVATFAVTPDNDMLVYDVTRDRINIPDQYDWIKQQRERFPWIEFQAIENASSGIGIIQLGAASGTPFETLKAITSKEARAATVATMYRQGKVYHLSGAAWRADLESELVSFPRGTHDDQVDAIAHAGNTITVRAAKQPRIRSLDVDDEAAPPSLDAWLEASEEAAEDIERPAIVEDAPPADLELVL